MKTFFKKLFGRGDVMMPADRWYYGKVFRTTFWSLFSLIVIAWVGTNLVLCALSTNVASNWDIIFVPRKPITLPTGYNLNEAITGYGYDKYKVEKIVFDYYTSEGEYMVGGQNVLEGLKKETLTSNQDGSVELYYTSDRANVYILSNLEMFANPESQFSFREMGNLETIVFNNFNTSQVTNMRAMFACDYYEAIDGGGGAIAPGTNISPIKNLDLSKWDVSHVTNMQGMFAGCVNAYTFNLSGWDTSSVTDMSYMFTMCINPYGPKFTTSNSKTLDLSSFDTSSVLNMDEMFVGNQVLETIYVSDRFDVSKVGSSKGMFYECQALRGQNNTKYSADHMDASYAYIDGKAGKAGYFTEKAYSGK